MSRLKIDKRGSRGRDNRSQVDLTNNSISSNRLFRRSLTVRGNSHEDNDDHENHEEPHQQLTREEDNLSPTISSSSIVTVEVSLDNTIVEQSQQESSVLLNSRQHIPLSYIKARDYGGQVDGTIDQTDQIDLDNELNALIQQQESTDYAVRMTNRINFDQSVVDPDDGAMVCDTGFTNSQDDMIGVMGVDNLQRLLKDEKRRSEQRRHNYNQLKFEHIKLKSDFDQLQSEMKDIVNENRLIRNKKTTENDLLRTINDKREQTIQQLRDDLKLAKSYRDNSTDFETIRDGHASNNFQIEKQNLLNKIDRLENELRSKDRHNNEELEQVRNVFNQDKLTYEQSIATLKHQLDKLRSQLSVIKSEPSHEELFNLQEENLKLRDQLDHLTNIVKGGKQNYARLESRLNLLLSNQSDQDENDGAKLIKLASDLFRSQLSNQELQLLLSTELQIKERLKQNLARMQDQNEHLENELDKQRNLLMEEKNKYSQLMQFNNRKNIEDNKKLKVKLSDMERMVHDKQDQNDTLSKRCSHLESKLNNQSNQIENSVRLDQQTERLKSKIEQLEQQLSEAEHRLDETRCSNENLVGQIQCREDRILQLTKEKTILNSKIRAFEAAESITEQIKHEREESMKEAMSLRTINKSLQIDKQSLERRVSNLKQDLSDSKTKFNEEKESFKSHKLICEKEIARLRENLSYECNESRKVLKELEKELVQKLKELESIKIRYKYGLSQHRPSRARSSHQLCTKDEEESRDVLEIE